MSNATVGEEGNSYHWDDFFLDGDIERDKARVEDKIELSQQGEEC